VALEEGLRGCARYGYLYYDHVSSAQYASHSVDGPGDLYARDVYPESERERRGDPVALRVFPVVLLEDLPAVLEVHVLLGLGGEAVPHPDHVEHLVELGDRGGHGDGPAVEPVERLM